MLRLVTVATAATLAAAVLLSAAVASPQHSFELGIVSNADGGSRARNISRLGARVVRVEFSIDRTTTEIAPVIAAFARRGVSVLPLAGFRGRLPTKAEARNLSTWAKAFGPSGTFWRHRSRGDLAIRDIEFGNETSGAYQYGGCSFGCPAFLERAHAYALAVKDAQEAIDGPLGNAGVGLLAIADDGGTGSADWVNGMFDAVPDLAHRVAGWTAHAYGPRSRWQRLLDQLVRQTRARGAPATIPIYITELGIATDNGRCLSDNYGWNPCMTYRESATSMESTLAEMRARYGARLRAVFIYQAFDQSLPGSDSNREHYFGVLTANGAEKGAYTATIRSLLRTLH